MEDWAYDFQDYLDIHTLVNYQLACPHNRNERLLVKMVNSYKETFLFHVLEYGLDCLELVDFKEFSKNLFSSNSYDVNAVLVPHNVWQERELYNIIVQIAETYETFVFHIHECCFKHSFFVKDLEFWNRMRTKKRTLSC